MRTETKQAISLSPLHNHLLRKLANVIKQEKSVKGMIIKQSQACSGRPVNLRTELGRLKVQGLLMLQTELKPE